MMHCWALLGMQWGDAGVQCALLVSKVVESQQGAEDTHTHYSHVTKSMWYIAYGSYNQSAGLASLLII